jgi:hypothetical protein
MKQLQKILRAKQKLAKVTSNPSYVVIGVQGKPATTNQLEKLEDYLNESCTQKPTGKSEGARKDSSR